MSTAEQLRAEFLYDPGTGNFTRKKFPDRVCGTVNGVGYIVIWWQGKLHLAHRLAWLYVTGKWPTQEVDHSNRHRANNSWDNLRCVSSSANRYNSHIRRDNKAGMTGVFFVPRRGKWRARVGTIDVGFFETAAEAQQARRMYLERYCDLPQTAIEGR